MHCERSCVMSSLTRVFSNFTMRKTHGTLYLYLCTAKSRGVLCFRKVEYKKYFVSDSYPFIKFCKKLRPPIKPAFHSRLSPAAMLFSSEKNISVENIFFCYSCCEKLLRAKTDLKPNTFVLRVKLMCIVCPLRSDQVCVGGRQGL